MRRGRPRHPELLTPREQEVLSLIREGLTNEQIAGRLGISESGARYHVSEILSKLGVSSRVEAAQWRGDVRQPAPAALPFIERLRQSLGTGTRPWAAAGIVLGVLAMVVLTLGVALNESRRSDSNAHGPTPTPGPEVQRTQELAEDAERHVEVLTPDAYLHQMVYMRTSTEELYSFRYALPDGSQIGAAFQTEPMSEGWTLSHMHIDEALGPPLDIVSVGHNPPAIMSTALAIGPTQMQQCESGCVLTLETTPNGTQVWDLEAYIAPPNQSQEVLCHLDDASPLQDLTCGGPAPIGATQPPVTLPITTTSDIGELADTALELAQLHAPDAYLFSLRGSTVPIVFSTNYWFVFFSPSSDHVMSLNLAIHNAGSSWEVGPPEASGLPQTPQLLDISTVQKSIGEVAEAAEAENIRRSEIELELQDGRLLWRVSGSSFGTELHCTLPDEAAPTALSCEEGDPVPSPTLTP